MVLGVPEPLFSRPLAYWPPAVIDHTPWHSGSNELRQSIQHNCPADLPYVCAAPAQLGAAQAGNSTSEIRLNVTDPGFGNGVFWNPRQPTSSA